MPEFFSLPPSDQRDALEQTQYETGRRLLLLEKDIWVVWALDQLFSGPFRASLVFKGGTSLSKVFHIIERFSEDVDITYDIRSLAPDLIDAAGGIYPRSRKQQIKWTSSIRIRLAAWIAEDLKPYFERAIADSGLKASVSIEGTDQLVIAYASHGLAEPPAIPYVSSSVKLEFGARSTGEPCADHHVTCDAATYLQDVSFPEGRPRVMSPERTFWEKATAIHVFCLRGRARDARFFSRHHHDVSRLHRSGTAEMAIRDRPLAAEVAKHKGLFFREHDRDGTVIDYQQAVSGQLNLVPKDVECLSTLKEDYDRMMAEGLLPNGTEGFETLMDECRTIEMQANAYLRS